LELSRETVCSKAAPAVVVIERRIPINAPHPQVLRHNVYLVTSEARKPVLVRLV
jgi:hypothetical protein